MKKAQYDHFLSQYTQGFCTEEFNNKGMLELLFTIQNADVELFEHLIKDTKTADGQCPFAVTKEQMVADDVDAEMIDAFADQAITNADAKYPNGANVTGCVAPVVFAIMSENPTKISTKMIDLLVDAGADINKQITMPDDDTQGMTPILMAFMMTVEKGADFDLVSCLMGHGASMDMPGMPGDLMQLFAGLQAEGNNEVNDILKFLGKEISKI